MLLWVALCCFVLLWVASCCFVLFSVVQCCSVLFSVLVRKHAGIYEGSPPSSTTHITFYTSCHLHITVSHSNSSTSHRIIFHTWGNVSGSVLTGLRLEAKNTSCGNEHTRRPAPVPASENTRKFGLYTGTRVGEAQNPGPATHERDWTVAEQHDATHRQINEAGDSVPSGQDSVTRAVQNLRISLLPCIISGLTNPASANNGEFQEAETSAQGAQGIPSLCAVWPSCRRPSGLYWWYGAKTRRSGAV